MDVGGGAVGLKFGNETTAKEFLHVTKAVEGGQIGTLVGEELFHAVGSSNSLLVAISSVFPDSYPKEPWKATGITRR